MYCTYLDTLCMSICTIQMYVLCCAVLSGGQFGTEGE